MKKRIFVLIIASVLLVSLCSCGIIKSPLDKIGALNEKEPETEPVTEQEQKTLRLNTYSAEIKVGETVSLTINLETDSASWSSTDDSVALVNSQGTVTGVKAGAANITCTADGMSATCTVTVTDDTPQQNVPQVGDIFADSSTRYITSAEASARFSELSGSYTPSGSVAQDAVNEIYARHGYVFLSQTILDYYSSKSWYTQNPGFSQSELNEYEIANIELFQKLK